MNAAKESQVETQLGMLDKRIHIATDSLDNLAGNLALVLTPPPPSKIIPTAKGESLVPLAARLEDLSARLYDLNERILDLSERIEL